MIIDDLNQFKGKKPGTIFSKYAPYHFSEIMCKRETVEQDFLYDSITNDVEGDSSENFIANCDAMQKGESRSLSVDSTTRDGMFKRGQLFAIYEREDIEQLIEKLKMALSEAYDDGH